jgi:hypothetical protein
MKETDCNTVLSHTFDKEYFKGMRWGFKISDFQGGLGVQNPFDFFGAIENKPLYVESKLIKNGLYAFNFNKIEDHQLVNLLAIKKIIPDALCLIAIFFWESRKMFKCLFVDINYIQQLIEQGKKSFLKKELEELDKAGKMFTVKTVESKKRIDFNSLATLEGNILQ